MAIMEVIQGDGNDGSHTRWWQWWKSYKEVMAMMEFIKGGDGNDGSHTRWWKSYHKENPSKINLFRKYENNILDQPIYIFADLVRLQTASLSTRNKNRDKYKQKLIYKQRWIYKQKDIYKQR